MDFLTMPIKIEAFVVYSAILVPALAYIIAVERRLTKIATDISWIRRNCESCQPTSEESS